MATLISIVFVGLGGMSITTRHYYGATSKLGGHEITLEGVQAIAFGSGMVVLGLLPLAIWFNSKRSAGLWALACLLISAVCFVMDFYPF